MSVSLSFSNKCWLCLVKLFIVLFKLLTAFWILSRIKQMFTVTFFYILSVVYCLNKLLDTIKMEESFQLAVSVLYCLVCRLHSHSNDTRYRQMALLLYLWTSSSFSLLYGTVLCEVQTYNNITSELCCITLQFYFILISCFIFMS